MDPVPAKAPASRTRAALELAITGAALLLACDLIRRMILRALFPLDLWIWSESPFLTNLLKLQAGVPLWGPPSDTNSFVYSPGLEYACRFLLSPFRLQFDITYLRAVAIALSVLTSLVANTMAFAAARSIGIQLSAVRWILGFCVALLLIGRNFTADLAHPDALFALWLMTAAALFYRGIRRDDWRYAWASIALSAIGVLIKQSGVGVFAAVWVGWTCFELILHRRMEWRRSVVLLTTGILLQGLSVALLWSSPYARFYTLDLLVQHQMDLRKLINPHALFSFPLGLIAVAAVYGLLKRWRKLPEAIKYAIGPVFLVTAAAIVSVPAALKTMGTWNNYLPLNLAIFLIAWPACLWALESKHRPLVLLSLIATLYSIRPIRQTPTPEHWRYAKEFSDRVRSDLDRGLRVLVAHGEAVLLQGGRRDIPLDRANSFLELSVAGKAGLSGFEARLASTYYDRIYLNSPWYVGMLPEIEKTYRETSRIRGVDSTIQYQFGNQGLMDNIAIFDRIH